MARPKPGPTILFLLLLSPLFASCAGTPPDTLGVHGDALSPCPDSPNCVSSDAPDEAHQVAPFTLAAPAPEAWETVRSVVASMPRTEVITQTSDYLHAESTSTFFRYVDDLELQLRAAESQIAVRSASRLGRSDLGVNRERVETLRALLIEAGAIR